jgi:hypothetical protein
MRHRTGRNFLGWVDWVCGRRGRVLALLLLAACGAQGQSLVQIGPGSVRADRVAARTQRFLRGRRGVGGVSAAELLGRARMDHARLAAERGEGGPNSWIPPFANGAKDGAPGAGGVPAGAMTASLTAAWTSVGPAQVVSASYGAVTGRVTAIAIDPADATGNTVYVGTTGGGVWKSTNAAGAASGVTFTALTDTLPVFSGNAGSGATASLSIGALGIANGVLLAGTGDPNDASDSYYGSGLLRSADGGVTWTLAQGSQDGAAGNHSFFGLSFSGFAFSTVNPSLMVAAVAQAAEGALVNAPDATNSVMGLYFSTNAGVTWQMGSIYDGGQPVQTPEPSGGNAGGNAAMAVVWNPVRQMFYAAVQFHGYYQSADGQTWTRMAHQPGAGLTTGACPTNPGSTGSMGCPLFRGALAVQPVTGDTFALTVDSNDLDQGLWRDVCGLSSGVCASSTVLFGSDLAPPGTSALEVGDGSTAIAQADYDLSLAAVASGTDTLVYAGTIDLFRCSLAGGCVLRNTTNAQNGCTNPAGVAGAQHAIATLAGGLVYVGNDGGIYRSTDGVNETGGVCSASDATHFQNLNSGMGSLAEVVSFAQHPTDPATLLAGLGALGTAGIGGAGSAWPQLATGEGGTVAIDAGNPPNWYVSTGAGVSVGRCGKGGLCAAADFVGAPVIGPAQVDYDVSAIDAPWILDPALTPDVVIGTCRAWRGPAASGSSWPGANGLSAPFGQATASGCGPTFPVVRSLAAGGSVSLAGPAAHQGSEVVYAGLAGALDGGGSLGGHLFTTAAANLANAMTAWTDAALGPVTNAGSANYVFNPGGFDVSSVTVDAHDDTGATVYATVMGFAGNGVNAAHVYRSNDGGGHWTNISSNLPNAPANSVVVDPNDANTVYIALDTGVYVTTGVTMCASANCWSVYGTALPNAPVIELEAAVGMATGDGRTGELRAATYGRGIWTIPLLTAVSPAAPGLALSPTALSFGSEQVQTLSPAQSVTVTNTGNAALTVSSVVASGDFDESDTCVGAAIAAGATCAVQVSFLPSATGARTGVLTVYGNAPGGQATVTLTGTGTAAAVVVLTPVSLTFPTTALGATSAVQNVTVSNTGGTTATLMSESVRGDFTISQNTCGAALAPDTGCTISIVFAPTVAGARGGAFTVVDSAGTQTASLSGSGSAAATDTLTPLSLSFAAQVLNSSSAGQQVELTNNGDAALTLIAAQITIGDFTVVNGCGNSLNGHSSCALSVFYAPKSLGGETGVLTVTDQLRSQTVALSGTGLAPAGVSLAPVGGLSFAAIAVGTLSATQTVTLTNNGGVALNLASLTASGDFFVQAGSSTCGSTVAAGAACTVQIGFAPTVAGGRSGLLTVSSNAVASVQSLALTGVGVDFTLAVDGPVSATIASGQSATYLLLLNSVAGVPGSAALNCVGAPPEGVCTVNPGSAALGAATPITVTVTTGVATARLRRPFDGTGWAVAWAGLFPLGLLGLRRRRGLRLVCAMLMGGCLLGCGASRTIPNNGTTSSGPIVTTPSGAYTITVSGTSAGLVRSVGLSLTVQ